MNDRKIIIILGPTAVGKTDLSIEVAEEIGAEIISADSRYLYRGMNIGTAKPDKHQLERVPHHLIDVASIEENWSLAQFKEAALESIEKTFRKGKLPILVGGTGQYIRSIIEGWDIPKKAPDEKMRSALIGWAERIGEKSLHEKLMMIDPVAAEKIDYRNLRRTIRALEVILHTGRKFSSQRDKKPLSFQYKMIGLVRPRKELYERIDQRIDQMMASGFIGEVESLLKKGYSLGNPPMSAIGYKEIIQYLKNDLTYEECINDIRRRTRQFVRRQANWFKETDERIRWFDASTVNKGETISFIMDKSGWIK